MERPNRPDVYILSDSLGETAEQVARAALSQFDEETFHVVRLPRVSSRGQLEGVVRGAVSRRCVFLYTLAEPKLREAMERVALETRVAAVDILGPVVEPLAELAHESPAWRAGMIRQTDRGYFERVEALDFAVQHDDGRNVELLDDAEIVLVGVSRTSKTPLSMYLAFKGYRVANVPLVPGVEAPEQIFEMDPRRVFGLIIEGELLTEIRRQRMHEMGPYAGHYADRESVEEELEESKAVMRRIGCIVVDTGSRAIEETAQEILQHFDEALGGHGAGEAGWDVPELGPPARRPRRRVPREGD